MDNNNEDDVQNVDNEVADVVTDCLQNSVVLRNILEHFASPELRRLSFVNKQWKNEAQSVMRKRGQFTAYVKAFDGDLNHPRAEVGTVICDLNKMNPVPFSGISLTFSFDPSCDAYPIEDPDPLQGLILDQPSLKTVSLSLMGSWWKNVLCPEVLLIKKIFQDCSDALEELELFIQTEHGREQFIQKVVQNFTFPRLKILKLREPHYGSDDVDYEKYMRAMLSRAPNLKVLHSNWSINLMLRVLEGSSVLPVYGSEVYPPFEEISEDVISAIKLERMKIEYTGRGLNFERLNRITPMLLQQCCTTTLRFMCLDALLAVPLMSYGIRLENVKSLLMNIRYDLLTHIQPRILEIVKNFDFTRIFPNLNEVVIADSNRLVVLSPNHVNAIIEQANAVLREPLLDRAANVKVLNLRQRSLSPAGVQFFAEMFPNIENLEIVTHADNELPTSFESIWKNWLDLKELKVRANMLPADGNLDSIFLGIFPEEVAELREKDEEYLKSVQIVPVMPALTGLKNLTVLSLIDKDPCYVPFGYGATFLFSKVTALIAFARRPALAVSLKVASRLPNLLPPVMTHLEPYVSITSGPVEDEWHVYDWLVSF